MLNHVKEVLDAKSDDEIRAYIHSHKDKLVRAHGLRQNLHPRVHETHADRESMADHLSAKVDKTHARVRSKKDIIKQHVIAIEEYLKTRKL